MSAQNDIQGYNCIFQTNIFGVYQDLVCIKSFSLNYTADTVETLSVGDGIHKNPDYDRLGYTLNISGLTQILDDDGKPTFLDLLKQMLGFLNIAYRILFIDNAGTPAILVGTLINTSQSLDKAPNSLLDSTVQLLGKGAAEIITVTETSTISFQVNGADFKTTNVLTDVAKCYKLNDKTVVSLTNETSDQQLSVTFKVPKLGGPAFGNDYSPGIHVGVTNVTFPGADADGSNWLVTALFDYVPATSNKILKLLIN